MSKVLLIGISKIKGDPLTEVKSAEAVKGKGLYNDRKFKENNDIKSQLTLIEIENVNYFNKISNTSIKPLNFRRNIVTEGIGLNKLINKEFFIGNIKVKGILYMVHALKSCPSELLETNNTDVVFNEDTIFEGNLHILPKSNVTISGSITSGELRDRY